MKIDLRTGSNLERVLAAGHFAVLVVLQCITLFFIFFVRSFFENLSVIVILDMHSVFFIKRVNALAFMNVYKNTVCICILMYTL